jgi:hypothetical protein
MRHGTAALKVESSGSCQYELDAKQECSRQSGGGFANKDVAS